MKLTLKQIEEIAGFLEGSLSPVTPLIEQVTDSKYSDMDDKDWETLYEIVEECPNCSIWVSTGSIYTDERTEDLCCEFCCDY